MHRYGYVRIYYHENRTFKTGYDSKESIFHKNRINL